MNKACIEGDKLIEENANKIFRAFSTLFRSRSKTVVNTIKSTDILDINTKDMNDETRGVSSFRNDSMLFYSDRYADEMPNDEQKEILNNFIEDGSFPKKSCNEVNFYDFKTPLNTVIATKDPEYLFIKNYLIKNENSRYIESWIKSRDLGFYTLEYSYRQGTHTQVKTFNPDFILKLNKPEKVYVFIEIKDEGDDSIKNRGKNKAAIAHFNLLNARLKEESIEEKYLFHFLSPEDYDVFFKYLREDKLDNFISGLDNLLNE